MAEPCEESLTLISKGPRFFKRTVGVSVELFEEMYKEFSQFRKEKILSKGGRKDSRWHAEDRRLLIYLDRLSTMMKICRQVQDVLIASGKLVLPGLDDLMMRKFC